MANNLISRDLLRELERQRKRNEQVVAAIERVERQLAVESALRFLNCIHSGGTYEECLGIYRLTPKPPMPFRRELKAALSKEDYALVSKAWR